MNAVKPVFTMGGQDQSTNALGAMQLKTRTARDEAADPQTDDSPSKGLVVQLSARAVAAKSQMTSPLDPTVLAGGAGGAAKIDYAESFAPAGSGSESASIMQGFFVHIEKQENRYTLGQKAAHAALNEMHGRQQNLLSMFQSRMANAMTVGEGAKIMAEIETAFENDKNTANLDEFKKLLAQMQEELAANVEETMAPVDENGNPLPKDETGKPIRTDDASGTSSAATKSAPPAPEASAGTSSSASSSAASATAPATASATAPAASSASTSSASAPSDTSKSASEKASTTENIDLRV